MQQLLAKSILFVCAFLPSFVMADYVDQDGVLHTGTTGYQQSSGGSLGAYTPPPTAATQGSTPSAEAMRSKECGDKLGAAYNARGQARATASDDYARELLKCPLEISKEVKQSDGSVVTYTPYKTCENGLAALKTAAIDAAESKFTQAINALPSYCPRPQQ